MSIVRTQPIVTEAQIRALAAEGHTIVKIAELLGVNLGMLRAAMSLMGIKSGRSSGGGGNHLRAKESHALLLDGYTLQEIADRRGVTRQAIYMELIRAKLPTNCRAAIAAKRQAAAPEVDHQPA